MIPLSHLHSLTSSHPRLVRATGSIPHTLLLTSGRMLGHLSLSPPPPSFSLPLSLPSHSIYPSLLPSVARVTLNQSSIYCTLLCRFPVIFKCLPERKLVKSRAKSRYTHTQSHTTLCMYDTQLPFNMLCKREDVYTCTKFLAGPGLHGHP